MNSERGPSFVWVRAYLTSPDRVGCVGSLAVALSRSPGAGPSLVGVMLATAPHRGGHIRTITLGACTLGVASREGGDETSLAMGDRCAAAIVGRIDNIDEIARRLERPPTGDTGQASLLMAAFQVGGLDLARRLRGAFAVALTDGKSLYCFRDHLGFAPLFYRDDAKGVFVATEAKQVLAGAQIPATPDLAVLDRIFYEALDDETPCALAGVRRLPKATTLVATGEGLSTSRYWDPERLLETGRFAASEIRPRFDELMAQAVRRVLTGHDIVTLSGGIDSPAVAAFAAPQHFRMSGRPLAALTAVYPALSTVDERAYVEVVVEALGISHHTYEPAARPLDDLAKWVRLADGPFPTTSMAEAHEMYGLARELGYRNVLTGELAEFFIDLRADLVPHLLSRGRIGAALRHLRLQRGRGARLGPLMRHVVATATPTPLLTAYGRARGRTGYLPDWIDPPSWSTAARPPPAPRHRWRRAQLAAFTGPGLSLEADELVQAVVGVRARRPWADVDLWEFFLSLPAETKFPDGRSKTLVRRLLKGTVPDAILERRTKTVFDDAVLPRIDYAFLRRWLTAPAHRVTGVDYSKLAVLLDREDLDVRGFLLARDLAAVHAFLGQW